MKLHGDKHGQLSQCFFSCHNHGKLERYAQMVGTVRRMEMWSGASTGRKMSSVSNQRAWKS